jgi:hypothetical protein
MRIAVPKSNFITDNPERLFGEENFFLTCGNHAKVMITVDRQANREIYVAI